MNEITHAAPPRFCKELTLKQAYAKHLEELGEMPDETPAAECVPEVQPVNCWNHDDRLAVVVSPDGEPLCESCAVTLAQAITARRKKTERLLRRRNRLAGAAPSVKSRG